MNKYIDLINKRLSEAKDFLNTKELNPKDPNLDKQLALGDNWDNPAEISKALDMHSTWQARWSKLYKDLSKEHGKLQAKFNVWESNKKIVIREELISKLKKKGLTEKQAITSITISQVDNAFNSIYNNKNKYYCKYHNPIDELNDAIEDVKIIVDAFKSRKDLLIVLGYLVKGMIETNMLVIKKKKEERR